MKTYLNIIAILFWALIILILLSIPSPNRVFPEEITYYDKLAHLFLFGVFAALLVNIFVDIVDNKYWQIALACGLFSVFFAYIGELIQLFVPGRSHSYLDLLSGAIGVGSSLVLYHIYYKNKKMKLLLHICCIGCGAYAAEQLRKQYKVILFFYNPNIYPESEYGTRLNDAKRIARLYKLKLIAGEYHHNKWLDLVRGYEDAKERGERCCICYNDRMSETAEMAKKIGADHFTTTLTASPHKDAKKIMEIGANLEKLFTVKFLATDFKKNDGFKRSAEISKKHGLYRQNYCGCEFSRKN